MATTNKPTVRTRKKPGPKPKVEATTDQGAAVAEAPKPLRFKFNLRDTITITASKEVGTVRARAEWATGNVSYFVAYTSTLGEYREAWIDEDLLTGFVERRKRAAKAAAAV